MIVTILIGVLVVLLLLGLVLARHQFVSCASTSVASCSGSGVCSTSGDRASCC